jgi:diaminopimelate decarboxylase/aspartate kinase
MKAERQLFRQSLRVYERQRLEACSLADRFWVREQVQADTDLARPHNMAPEIPWVVMKFGGTSVSSKARWQTIGELLAERITKAHVVVVVSALSGTTDQLEQLIRAADLEARLEIVRAIRTKHAALIQAMQLADDVLDAHFERLESLCREARAPAQTFPWQAEVLASGELASSTLGALWLKTQGLPVEFLDAREHLLADRAPSSSNWAQHLSVNCTVHPSPKLRQQLSMHSRAFITQGFIARDIEGRTAILGRGGSDTSASYFGALLAAERVEIWTDVPGMFTANPRVVSEARLLKRLDYDEAQEIAATGAKVLHPRCLGPVRDTNVPLWVKDTQRPELAGTVIVPASHGDSPRIKALSWRRNITLVSMESLGMWQQVGFLADVFASFKRHGLSVDLIGSSETNVTVSLDPSQNLLDPEVLKDLCQDLAQVCRVKVIAPCAALTLVGRGMRQMLDRLTQVFAELNAHRVHLLTQASNDLNLTFVVDEQGLDALVVRLHAALIDSRLLPTDKTDVLGPTWNELSQGAEAHTPSWWRGQREALLRIAEQQSPVYVYSGDEIAARASALKQISAVSRWHYALKANAHPQVLATLKQQGFGLETVSLGEIQAALRQVAPEHILYTPNFPSRAELRAALELGVHVTLDSLYPLAHWGEDFAGQRVLLRVDLGEGKGHHDKVRTGGARSKFGVAVADLPEFKRLAARAGVQIVGLHAHLGSGILASDHWLDVGQRLLELSDMFPQVEILDLGGGLGVPSRAGERALNLDDLGQKLARLKLQAPQFEFWMEPGRYLVADAGVLLARVTQAKLKQGVHFVGLETGMNSLIRPALYDAAHEIVNLSRLDAPHTILADVVGPICETGDVLRRGVSLPQTREGDVMLIAQAGAYGAVMASHYNLRNPAGEVML